MPSNDQLLFLKLADAYAQPSKASRAATAALDIPNKGIEGYLQGTQAGDMIQKSRMGRKLLGDVLGNGIEGVTINEADSLAKPLEAYAALQKAQREGMPKPGDNYNADQTEAVSSGDPTKLISAFPGGVPRTAVAANTTARGVTGKNDFFGKRGGQIDLSQLPSELGPSTGAGAAYGVKVAARQGKALVANPGSAQRISLGSGDIARAVLRAAPQLDALRGANFAENLSTRWSSLTQKLTANPEGTDAPEIRKEMYDILDELDKSATPFIANHLANYEDMLGPLNPAVKKREMGETLPNIPFNPGGVTSSGTVRIKASDGTMHDIPRENLGKAKQIDPGLQVTQ